MLLAAWGRRTDITVKTIKKNDLESSTKEGDSPVFVPSFLQVSILSSTGPEKSSVNQPVPSGKAKYFQKTDSEPVP